MSIQPLIRPARFDFQDGSPPRPWTWQATIAMPVDLEDCTDITEPDPCPNDAGPDQPSKYYGKGPCNDWDEVLWWYPWVAMWDNDTGQIPAFQPILIGDVDTEYEEDDYPNKFTVGRIQGRRGRWAINTAEFDYLVGMCRSIPCSGLTPGSGFHIERGTHVLMSVGFFDDMQKCTATDPQGGPIEARTPRLVCFFHQYRLGLDEECFDL